MQRMQLSKAFCGAVVLASLVLPGVGAAQDSQWAPNRLSLTPENTATGLQLQSPFSQSLRLRLGLATSRFDSYIPEEPLHRARPGEAEPIAGALLDYHVNRFGLRFTGGALYSSAAGNGTFMSSYEAGEVDPARGLYDGAYINRYDAGYERRDQVLPYLGLGWGQAFGAEQRLQLKMDFGIAFQGVSDLDGTSHGTKPTGSSPGLDTYRLEEELGWESQFESLRYSFSAGVRYRF